MGRKQWTAVLIAALAVAIPAYRATGAQRTAPSWTARAGAEAARMRSGVVPAIAAGTAAITATPSPVVSDPAGDVPFAAGDITSAGFGQNHTGFVFSVNLATPTDPATDPNWQDGLAFAGWAMDVNNDGLPEYVVLVAPLDPSGGISAVLFGFSTSFSCGGRVTFVAGKGLRAAFSSKCRLPITHFHMQAAVSYTDDPEAEDPPLDTAPNEGFSRSVPFAGGAPADGYWMLDRDGRGYAFGEAPHYPGRFANGDAVAIASKPGGAGYWIVSRDGTVHAFGAASNLGGRPPLAFGEIVTSIAASPTGGYWLFSNRGRVFPFGGAHSFGDLSDMRLNAPVVAGAASASGLGYQLFAADGGVFAFGDAPFRGSLSGRPHSGSIVGGVPSPDGAGYWLLASDGGVFAFNAQFHGSLAGRQLRAPVTDILAFGDGYLIVARDGGAFDFSTSRFLGGLGARVLPSPITGVAALTG